MSLESLPEPLLDAIVGRVISSSSSHLSTLLVLSPRLRQSCLRFLFRTLLLPDDARHLPKSAGGIGLHLPQAAATAFLAEPDVYGQYVRILKIVDPIVLARDDRPSNMLFHLDDDGNEQVPRAKMIEPVSLGSKTLTYWLSTMHGLEEFVWTSVGLPPEGICETLAVHNKALKSFVFMPTPAVLPAPVEKSTLSAARCGPLKWDAPSMPHLAQLAHLTTLRISRLSQAGSRGLSHLLRIVASSSATHSSAEDSGLEHLTIDVVWFDEELCEAITSVGSEGRKLKTLCVGTGGTKLRDKGLDRLLTGSDGLEEFDLKDVQGRISRSFWSTTITPPSLRSLSISLSESGPHHSWTADHLQSLGSLQLTGLRTIRINRSVSPLHKMGLEGPVDDVGKGPGLEVPKDVVDALKGGELRVLDCDWWTWKLADLKSLVEDCPHLETIKVAFDAPFNKIFVLISSLAGLSKLRSIALSIPPQHAPLPSSPTGIQINLPPSPTVSYMPLTPSTSPVKGGYHAVGRIIEPPTPPVENVGLPLAVDTAIPPVREIKKLARRCDKLQTLEWYGRNARGMWIIEREPVLKVSYIEPAPPSEDLCERVRWEQEVAQMGWKPAEREGQAWGGSAWLEAEVEKEKQREREKEREKEREEEREREKKEKERRKSVSSGDSTALSPKSPMNALPPVPPLPANAPNQFPLPSACLPNPQGKRTPRRMQSESTLHSTGASASEGRLRSANGTDGAAGRGRGGRGGRGGGGAAKGMPNGGGGRGRAARSTSDGARGAKSGGGKAGVNGGGNGGAQARRGGAGVSRGNGRAAV